MMNKATFNNKTYQVPGSLNELSAWQLCALAELIHQRNQAPVLAIKCILVLLEVKKKWRLKWLFFRHITGSHLQQLIPLTNFLFREENLTKNILPVLRLPWRFTRFYGPGDNMANLTFLEYIRAEAAFIQFHRTKKEIHLNTLAAILYRPKAKVKAKPGYETEDSRERFNDATVSARATLMGRLPVGTRLAILLFFTGCRQLFIKQHPEVFPEKAAGSMAARRLGWAGVLRNLAGHLNQFEATGEQNILTVLFDLKAGILEAQEREAKTKE